MNKNSSNSQINITDTISRAQTDMRKGYANGSIGIIISGLIWLTSAIVSFQFSAKHAIWTLLIGGMFIHPLCLLVGKAMGLSGTYKRKPSRQFSYGRDHIYANVLAYCFWTFIPT